MAEAPIRIDHERSLTLEPHEDRPPALPGKLRDFELPLANQSLELLQHRIRWQSLHRRSFKLRCTTLPGRTPS
jgi:hypothetical protein